MKSVNFEDKFSLAVITGVLVTFIVLLALILTVLLIRKKVRLREQEHLNELKKLTNKSVKEHVVTLTSNGNKLQIKSSDILFVKSERNYIEIQCKEERHVIREKISDFPLLVPDSDSFLRVHRSYIVRLDNIKASSLKSIKLQQYEIPVGKTYHPKVKEFILNIP